MVGDIFFHPKEPVQLKPNMRNLLHTYSQQLDCLYLDSVVVIFNFGEYEKNFLHQLKYGSKNPEIKDLDKIFAQIWVWNIDRVVYPSLSIGSWLQRPGNHVKRLFSPWDLFHVTPKITITSPFKKRQALRSRWNRMKGITNTFRVAGFSKKHLPRSRVLLVDDVISTGNTANEIARICKEGGARSVHGLFLFSSNHSEP